jgi:hypothetical protein
MNKVEAQLGRLDEFLARAPRDARSRAEIAGNLREHARTLMAARLGHGWSVWRGRWPAPLLRQLTTRRAS